MARGVYSERLLFATAVGGDVVTPHAFSFVVPQGKRAVIKSLTAFNNGAVSGGVGLFLATIPVWYMPVPSLQGVTIGGIMVVAYPGEALVLSLTIAVSGQASGYLLDDAGDELERGPLPADVEMFA